MFRGIIAQPSYVHVMLFHLAFRPLITVRVCCAAMFVSVIAMSFPFQATSIDTLEITLKISDIQESHFTTYILTARNDIGTAEKQISLQEGE